MKTSLLHRRDTRPVRQLSEPERVVKDSDWYKRGVIYEVPVRGFHDSNSDGTGDFKGLTAKLDYLRDLGVTALWLLPFYPSPLKDDGYDIANYFDVHPMYGTLDDFKQFLRQAHRRGLRVITELVLNHTSDQHPWFQRARRAPAGSRWRDYYVWSDAPEKYKGTRIIFKDTEISNWTWDPIGKAYFWHRFYSHQPDLNFDNPIVHREMRRVLDFWLELGVDGVRLDAVPYLYEREGTDCENLPETHQFLKELRAHVDEKFGDRMLLGEANQWPDDAVAYFGGGNGDECHMIFHFPLMPRLFMSLRMEDRIPIVDILQQTPPIPDTAQWALFLRNHDELTLEMVTDEERDYMYRMYAHTHQARLNLGIRRRLAPLLGNDRRRIELLNALLFSLPGTPVIYYGDEIGMGENIYLGDRNGVRTPMQWSADRNAGFSTANPQSLYLPINLDPENHYEAVNVDVQQRNPDSLLWWTKRLITLHKRWKAFGIGTLEFLHPENRRIFACVRKYQEEECVLVVANLSRFVQPVELDLSQFRGRTPVELFGSARLPTIGNHPYFLTLGPYAFFWLSLESPPEAEGALPLASPARTPLGGGRGEGSAKLPSAVPSLTVWENWEEILDEPRSGREGGFEKALRRWLPTRRWFGAKARAIKSIHVSDVLRIPTDREPILLVMLDVDYQQFEPETYLLPLACAFGKRVESISHDSPAAIIAKVTSTRRNSEGLLYDAMGDTTFCNYLLEAISGRARERSLRGEIRGAHYAAFVKQCRPGAKELKPSVGNAEQSNSAVIYGKQIFLKLFRRLDRGTNPELEILQFLTRRKFPWIPPLGGELEYFPSHGRSNGSTPSGESAAVAIVSGFLPGCKDGYEFTLDALERFYERALAFPPETKPPALASGSLLKRASKIDDQCLEAIGTYAESARLLGERTAALHLVFASDSDHREFTPEPFTAHAQRGLYQSLRNLTRNNFQMLSRQLPQLTKEIRPRAEEVLAKESEILKRFRAIYERPLHVVRTRHHGDYHLGQVLHSGKDFYIIDFQGEPDVAPSERRLKRSPLRDVAGMIRSFDYAAHAALLRQIEGGRLKSADVPRASAWGRFWAACASAIFFNAYRQAAGSAPFVPNNDRDLEMMLDVFLLRKAIYEIGYELNNRPDWLTIPLDGILQHLQQPVTQG